MRTLWTGAALLALALLVWALDPFASALPFALAVVFPVIARTPTELAELANPPAGKGVSEAVPWMFYDTEAYDSGTTTSLTFFQTTKATRQLSNMETAGQIPAPQFFECYYVGLDILTPPTDTLVAPGPGAWEDAWSILFGTGTAGQGGPTWTFQLSQKEYGPFPLSTLHGTGGLHGSNGYGATGVATDTRIIEFSTNSVPDGGWCQNGAIMIPPTVGFRIRVDWPAAVTLTADRDLRLNMLGTLHRRVL